jgi:sortase A
MAKRRASLFQLFTLTILSGILFLSGCSGSTTSSTALAQDAEPAPPASAPKLARPPVAKAMPDRLVLPAIQLDIPVVELGWSTKQQQDGQIFSEWDVAEYAAGWHKNSARLGEGGNIVMSGHNNILGSVFRELDQLKRGDEVTVWSGSQAFAYTVDKVMIVPEKYATMDQRKENAKWIGTFEDDRLTLVSCWPRDDNTHRIIVVAHAKG